MESTKGHKADLQLLGPVHRCYTDILVEMGKGGEGGGDCGGHSCSVIHKHAAHIYKANGVREHAPQGNSFDNKSSDYSVL